MSKFFRNMSLLILCGLCIGCAAHKEMTVDESTLNKVPSAYITVEIKGIALGIGGEKGTGILKYNGNEYNLKFKGIDYGTIGKTKVKASGAVYNLEKLEDIEGTFLQAKAGVTLGKAGTGGKFWVNAKGVTVHMTSDEESGFELSIGRGGVKVKLDE